MRSTARPNRASLVVLLALLSLLPAVAPAQSLAGPIQTLHSSRAPRLRLAAVREIGRTRPEGGRQALEAALHDGTPNVRRAAALTLGEMGDRNAIDALRGDLEDRDRNVRTAAQASVRALSSLPAVTAPTQAAVGVPAVAATAPAQVTTAPIDWRRVRTLVTLTSVSQRGAGSPADAELVRSSIRQAIAASPGLAVHPGGTLPAAAQARLRARTMRWYSLEGSITSLQRTQDAQGVHVRAELSIAILAEPAHNIIGTVNTAASASEGIYPGGTDPTQRLSRAAIEVASRGVAQRLQQQFGAPAPAGRRRR